jgi:hypothetical protein
MLNPLFTQRRAAFSSPLSHQDESPAEYSLVGCSPAEPTSASSAMLILNRKPTKGDCFSANGNCPQSPLSHLTTQVKPSCGGSRWHRRMPAFFGWRAACARRGGNPPARAFPFGGNGKGGSTSLLPQACFFEAIHVRACSIRSGQRMANCRSASRQPCTVCHFLDTF